MVPEEESVMAGTGSSEIHLNCTQETEKEGTK